MNRRTLLPIIAVSGALLFSGYGYAASQVQKKTGSSVEQSPQQQRSSKTISFNGIPLGKPGVEGALQKLCMAKKFNSMDDRCSFNEEGRMILLDYETLVDTIALVTVSKDKALTKVVIDGSTQEMLALAHALEKKYGKPQKQSSIVKKEVGTLLDTGNFELKEAEESQLDKETFVWVDDQGSRIIVESIYSDYDKGGVTIESTLAAAQNSAGNKSKEPGK